MSPLRVSALLATLALAACGTAREAPDVAAYEQLVSDAQASVEHHRTAATAADTQQACQEAHTQYAAEIQAIVTHMRTASGGVDGCLTDMGHPGDADLTSTCDAMGGELTRHARDACASSDAAVNRAEATRHCDAMKSDLDHQLLRAQGMAGMMSGRGMMTGGSCTP
jgi:hypothetical protein